MGIVSKVRKQDAVWWESTGFDEFGVATFANPVDTKCRWDGVQAMAVDDDGDEFISNAEVMVDRAMKQGDYLWLGLKKDLVDLSKGPKENNAFRVRAYLTTPSIRNKAADLLREVILGGN